MVAALLQYYCCRSASCCRAIGTNIFPFVANLCEISSTVHTHHQRHARRIFILSSAVEITLWIPLMYAWQREEMKSSITGGDENQRHGDHPISECPMRESLSGRGLEQENPLISRREEGALSTKHGQRRKTTSRRQPCELS